MTDQTRADRALALIASNPRRLTDAGHRLLNSGVPELLATGRIVYDPKSNTGYRPA